MSGRNIIVGVGLAGAVLLAGSTAPAWARLEVAKLTIDEPPLAYSGFGQAVTICGEYIVVGAPGDDELESHSGAAYVFKGSRYTWVEQAKLKASDPGFNDAFGGAVAIDGDLLVVGAPEYDPAGMDFGRAYVFRREGSAWIQEAKLVPSASFERDYFGLSVSISGELAVVGAPGTEFDLGYAYVFRREGTTWIEEAALIGSDTEQGDWFGESVSINRELAIVGAPLHDGVSSDSGSAYVFRRTGVTWAEDAKLTASDAGQYHGFGWSVSVSGDAVAVARNDAGYVFRKDDGSWTEEARVTGAGGAWSVSLDGDYLVVGAYRDNQAGDYSGSAYLFVVGPSGWVELDELVPSDAGPGRMFGETVSVFGDFAVIGGVDTNSAYVFFVTADIPAISGWGVLLFAVLVLTAGTLVLRRHWSKSAVRVAKG